MLSRPPISQRCCRPSRYDSPSRAEPSEPIASTNKKSFARLPGFIIHEEQCPSLRRPCLTLSATIWRRLRPRYGHSWSCHPADRRPHPVSLVNGLADEVLPKLQFAAPPLGQRCRSLP